MTKKTNLIAKIPGQIETLVTPQVQPLVKYAQFPPLNAQTLKNVTPKIITQHKHYTF